MPSSPGSPPAPNAGNINTKPVMTGGMNIPAPPSSNGATTAQPNIMPETMSLPALSTPTIPPPISQPITQQTMPISANPTTPQQPGAIQAVGQPVAQTDISPFFNNGNFSQAQGGTIQSPNSNQQMPQSFSPNQGNISLNPAGNTPLYNPKLSLYGGSQPNTPSTIPNY